MTYEEINEMMAEMGLPYADNVAYHNFKQLDIELYADKKNPVLEEEIGRCGHSMRYITQKPKRGLRVKGSMKYFTKWRYKEHG